MGPTERKAMLCTVYGRDPEAEKLKEVRRVLLRGIEDEYGKRLLERGCVQIGWKVERDRDYEQRFIYAELSEIGSMFERHEINWAMRDALEYDAWERPRVEAYVLTLWVTEIELPHPPKVNILEALEGWNDGTN